MRTKTTSHYDHFESLDIRVGRIVNVEDAETRKPTYRLTVDFGPEVGLKVSCGAYRNYSREALLGRLVIGVVNFETKRMGPEKSEALILGVQNANLETIYLTPESEVPLGATIF